MLTLAEEILGKKLTGQNKIDFEIECVFLLERFRRQREAYVLVLRSGIDGNGQKTFVQIGKKISSTKNICGTNYVTSNDGVTSGRIRQLFYKAIRILKHPKNLKYLNKYGERNESNAV